MLRELPHCCWNLKKKDRLLLAATQQFCWGIQEGVLNLYTWMAKLIIICLVSIGNLSEGLQRLRGLCGNFRGRIMRRESRLDRICCEFARWISIMLLFRSGVGGASLVFGRYRKDSTPGCYEWVLLFRTSSVWLTLSRGSTLARGSRSSRVERALWKGVVSLYTPYGLAQTRRETQVGKEQKKGNTVYNPSSILIWTQEKNSLLMNFSAEDSPTTNTAAPNWHLSSTLTNSFVH